MTKTRFRESSRVVRPDGKALKSVTFKKPLDEMTPEERIVLARQFEIASREYIRLFTEDWMRAVRTRKRFSIGASWEIIRTMPPAYNEAFIHRTDRLASIAEGLGFVIKFSKWGTTKEYGWLCEKEKN